MTGTKRGLLETGGSWAATLLTLFIRAYRVTIAPWLGPRCRFHPSCSQYAVEAIDRHGALRGSGLTASRLVRCQPFSAGGFDPVPPTSQRL